MEQLKAVFEYSFDSVNNLDGSEDPACSVSSTITSFTKQFEHFPMDKEAKSLLENIKTMAKSSSIFGNESHNKVAGVWSVFGKSDSNVDGARKTLALKQICRGQYSERDLVHIRLKPDMSEGWAFTSDSFCWYQAGQGALNIPYESMKYVRFLNSHKDKISTLDVYERACLATNEDYGIRNDKNIPGFLVICDTDGVERSIQIEGATTHGIAINMVSYLTHIGDLYGLHLGDEQVEEQANSNARLKTGLRDFLAFLQQHQQ